MLKDLNLGSNQISSIPPFAFDGAANLRVLDLRQNRLAELPVLRDDSNVTTLILHHNKIKFLTHHHHHHNRRGGGVEDDLPLRLGGGKLHTLDLSHNKIGRLPNGAFPANNSLVHLYLHNNKISHVERDSLKNLTKLETLRLGKNRISALPKNLFTKSASMKLLDLNRNRIRTLDGLIFNGLGQLEVLKLRRNHVATLMDGCFWGLGSIQYLQMDYNNLTFIGKEWLYGLNNLNQLSLSNNRISRIDPQGWGFTQRLMDLDLANNEIRKIASDTFQRLFSLQNLYLDDNEISSIENEAFTQLTNLQILELQGNQISWTLEDMNGPFFGLSNLLHLGLKSNEIKTISKDSFLGLTSLRHLDLTDNEISSIQFDAFAEMPSLMKLRLNSSNLLCDCHLNWFPRFVEEKRFEKTVIATCIHPEPLKGVSILRVAQDDYKCDDFPKPILRTEPSDKNFLRGENQTLECAAASSSSVPMKYQWKKNNVPLDGDDDEANIEHFVVTSKNNAITVFTTRLRFNGVRDSDAGVYQCVISNQFGASYSKRAEINVYTLPVFIKTPLHVTVYPGSTARFECSADGSPKPEVAWQKDGGDDFPAARERRMHVMASDVFFITNAKSADEGVYTCKATNAAGVVYVNASLTLVRGAGGILVGADGDASHPPNTGITTRPGGGAGSNNNNNNGVSGGGSGHILDPMTTTGVIIIAVVCCVVGTSLVWVFIIYQSRKKREECSTSGTEETSVSDSEHRAHCGVGGGGVVGNHRFPHFSSSSHSISSLSKCQQYGAPPIYSALGLEQYQAMVPSCTADPPVRPFTYPWVVASSAQCDAKGQDASPTASPRAGQQQQQHHHQLTQQQHPTPLQYPYYTLQHQHHQQQQPQQQQQQQLLPRDAFDNYHERPAVSDFSSSPSGFGEKNNNDNNANNNNNNDDDDADSVLNDSNEDVDSTEIREAGIASPSSSTPLLHRSPSSPSSPAHSPELPSSPSRHHHHQYQQQQQQQQQQLTHLNNKQSVPGPGRPELSSFSPHPSPSSFSGRLAGEGGSDPSQDFSSITPSASSDAPCHIHDHLQQQQRLRECIADSINNHHLHQCMQCDNNGEGEATSTDGSSPSHHHHYHSYRSLQRPHPHQRAISPSQQPPPTDENRNERPFHLSKSFHPQPHPSPSEAVVVALPSPASRPFNNNNNNSTPVV